MGRRLEYEVKTSVRLNMSNPQHVKINDVIQNLDPKIFKSKNQFIIDALLLPSSARTLIRFLLTDTTAISAPAKKAFTKVRNARNNS